jgi:hypothetical protein
MNVKLFKLKKMKIIGITFGISSFDSICLKLKKLKIFNIKNIILFLLANILICFFTYLQLGRDFKFTISGICITIFFSVLSVIGYNQGEKHGAK